jgi:hypothetical protein
LHWSDSTAFASFPILELTCKLLLQLRGLKQMTRNFDPALDFQAGTDSALIKSMKYYGIFIQFTERLRAPIIKILGNDVKL